MAQFGISLKVQCCITIRAVQPRLIMPYEPQRGERKFSHCAVRLQDRLVIHSICLKCGASKIIQSDDGTLEEWVNEHQCKVRQSALQAA
jgi:hypothetical protein